MSFPIFNSKVAKGRSLLAGAELGLYTFLGFAFQAIGLLTTSASRSAFLLYLNVKFVPLFAWLLYGRQISPNVWLSAALALLGTFLLSTDGGSINAGDIWCIGAAASSAMFVLRLEDFVSNRDTTQNIPPAELNAISSTIVTVLCFLWAALDLFVGHMVTGSDVQIKIENWIGVIQESPGPLLYLGFVISGLCSYLQSIGQQGIPAEKAAIIYSMDPVYAAFFSWAFAQESLSSQGRIGAVLILSGVWLSNLSNNSNSSAEVKGVN